MDSCKLPFIQKKNQNTIPEKKRPLRRRQLIENFSICHLNVLKQFPGAHLCPNGCSLWSHKQLPQGSAPGGSLVGCTEQQWGSQEAPRDFFSLFSPAEPWPCYLESLELLWDWLEDVVAPLSWEKPLLHDSKLDMDPLKSLEASTS